MIELTLDDIEENVIIIRLTKSYREGMSELELYDATRGCWDNRNRYIVQEADYVLSVFEGKVIEVYSVDRWMPAEKLNRITSPYNPQIEEGRIGFIGKVAVREIRNKYIGKSVKKLFKKGDANPVRLLRANMGNNKQLVFDISKKAYCNYCGEEMPADANYCPFCGAKAIGEHKTVKEEFLNKTRLALDGFNEECIESRAFEIRDDDIKEERCVLVMGLNPAGNEEDAIRGRLDRTYFFHMDTENDCQKNWINNKYFRPIFELVEKTTGTAKWAWCNRPWNEIENEIKTYLDLQPLRETIKVNYDKNKDNEFTIYIGDMFYYHETKSKQLPLRKDIDYYQYARDMLKLHIDCLKKHNKKIEYVYINNAQVSHWLCGEDIRTFDVIEGVPVYYGAILSGMMDAFSKCRLEAELLHRKDHLIQ